MIIPFFNRHYSARTSLTVPVSKIYESAGFTDHVSIIAALGQVAMPCQQYHTSHLRLVSGEGERTEEVSRPLFMYP